MAVQGRRAFTPEIHAELLRLAPHLSDVELAAKFGVTVPTVIKYKRLPVEFTRQKLGRPKREAPDRQEEAGAA